MSRRQVMRRWRYAVALLVASALGLSASTVRAVNPNEREIKPAVNVQDKDEINKEDGKLWVLNFIFKDPRPITIDITGKGKTNCWYLVYSVVNTTKQPHTFIPDIELVTQDKDTVHLDKILPTVQKEIAELEGARNLKNSVTIAAEPIPPSRENADPTRVTGVAIWEDLPETNHFYIYVSGLSNGWSVTDPGPGETDPVVRRKTLRLEFSRKGDPALLDARQIKFEGAEWKYRGSALKVPGLPPEPSNGKKEKALPPPPPEKGVRLPPPTNPEPQKPVVPARGVKLAPPDDSLLEPPPPPPTKSTPPRGN